MKNILRVWPLVVALLSAEILALFLFNPAMQLFSKLIIKFDSDWAVACEVVLLGGLLFGSSMAILILGFKAALHNLKVSVLQIIEVFIGSFFVLYGSNFLGVGLLSLGLLIAGAVFHIPVL